MFEKYNFLCSPEETLTKTEEEDIFWKDKDIVILYYPERSGEFPDKCKGSFTISEKDIVPGMKVLVANDSDKKIFKIDSYKELAKKLKKFEFFKEFEIDKENKKMSFDEMELFVSYLNTNDVDLCISPTIQNNLELLGLDKTLVYKDLEIEYLIWISANYVDECPNLITELPSYIFAYHDPTPRKYSEQDSSILLNIDMKSDRYGEMIFIHHHDEYTFTMKFPLNINEKLYSDVLKYTFEAIKFYQIPPCRHKFEMKSKLPNYITGSEEFKDQALKDFFKDLEEHELEKFKEYTDSDEETD